MGQTKEQFIRDRENSDQMPEFLEDDFIPYGPDDLGPEPTDDPMEETQLPRLAMPSDLKRLSITKGSIADQAINIIQHSQEQGIPAYQLKAYSKFLELLAKEIGDRVSDEATDELAKEGGEIGLAGLTLKKKSSAGRWDYSEVPGWAEKKRELESIQEAGQLAYKLACKKPIGSGPVVTDPQSGEVLTPAKFYPGREIVEITVAK